MTLNSIPMDGKLTVILLLLCLRGLVPATLTAQTHYAFNCNDYVSTDNNRAPQSAFSYNTESNSFTINGSQGSNNIAFQMSKAVDGKYFINNDEEWFVVEGTNLSTTTGEQSVIWWFNGFNRGTACPAEKRVDNGETKLFLWNMHTNELLNPNMSFEAPRITISSHGAGFIHAMGFTAASGTQATITHVGYFSTYSAIVAYPVLISTFNYTEESLTTEVKTKVEEAIARANAMKPVEDSDLAALITEVANTMKTLEPTDYVTAIDCLYRLNESIAQYAELHPTVSYTANENGITARYNEQYIRIAFHTDDIVRVCKTYATETMNKKSMSVILEPKGATKCDITESNGIVTITGTKLSIDYNLNKSTISVTRLADNRKIIEEKEAASFMARKDGPDDSYTVSNTFLLDDDEYIFGMGQIQDGNLNLRGKSYHLEIASLKVVIPYFQSTKDYALFWDNYSPTEFTDSELGTQFSSTGTEIDYYVIVGNGPQEVLALERQLTGKCPMPALWNFGLYQSRQRYMSTQQVMDVVGTYREQQVPLDCVVQDWQYWGDDAHWNAMEFLNPSYFNYQEMIDYVHDNNAKLMISVWSNFGPSTKPFEEMQQKGHLMTGNSYPFNAGVRPYDPWSEEARDIYWKYLYNGIASKGIDAYWMDSTEPDYAALNGDSDFDFMTGYGKTWRSMRNTFPLAAVGGVHDHHRAAEAEEGSPLAGKRVSILTRSAFLGQQRYGANTWSSDISASWNTLADQIPAALNFSACGIPYWNSDTGAFFGGNTNDSGWRRLFLRWVQFSCFCPMMRIHGNDNWREIYQFGSQHDGIGDYDQFLKYIRLRYRLIPYLYSTAWQISKNDQPFMQALPLAFENDRGCYDIKDEYMFGQSFLVAPIVQDGVGSRTVYLPFVQGHPASAKHQSTYGAQESPRTSQWIDFWTGESLGGGQQVTKQVSADIIPLYVRAGTILPWGPDVQYATEKPWDDLEIRVYPGADGEFTLYEDENDNYNYEQGQYSEIPFSWDEETKTLTIGTRAGSFSGMLPVRTFRIVKVSTLRGIGDQHTEAVSKTVTYDGNELKVVLDMEDRPVVLEDITDKHISNPSFEDDGRTLTKVAPKGWTVESTTAWWGVNQGGGSGDPVATDGQFIFGVWDGSNTISPQIYQQLTLPAGKYRLTVDMHASNRGTGTIRIGKQRLFAGDNIAYMRDEVMAVGGDDSAPLQTVTLNFSLDKETTLPIGVATDGAPAETWFKIDNFRLYTIPDVVVGINPQHVQGKSESPSTDKGGKSERKVYDLRGHRIPSTSHLRPSTLYISGHKKTVR